MCYCCFGGFVSLSGWGWAVRLLVTCLCGLVYCCVDCLYSRLLCVLVAVVAG